MRKQNLLGALVCLLAVAAGGAGGAAHATPVALVARDGVRVTGEEYAPTSRANGTIVLLFHQAGSNLGEYAAVAPRFARMGFRCLAIDQRSGGAKWGRSNETVLRLRGSADYGEALPDLQAALDWATAKKPRRVIVVGSSYSAALVFLLAANNPNKVGAIVAFSPGEYLSNPQQVGAAARGLTIPVLAVASGGLGEEAAASAILSTLPRTAKGRQMVVVSPERVHGVSMLRPDRNPNGSASLWQTLTRWMRAQGLVSGAMVSGR